jgi:membrane protease subunit (stomatin/prohibitin family)
MSISQKKQQQQQQQQQQDPSTDSAWFAALCSSTSAWSNRCAHLEALLR